MKTQHFVRAVLRLVPLFGLVLVLGLTAAARTSPDKGPDKRSGPDKSLAY